MRVILLEFLTRPIQGSLKLFVAAIPVYECSMQFMSATKFAISYSSLNLGTIKYAYHFRLLELKK